MTDTATERQFHFGASGGLRHSHDAVLQRLKRQSYGVMGDHGRQVRKVRWTSLSGRQARQLDHQHGRHATHRGARTVSCYGLIPSRRRTIIKFDLVVALLAARKGGCSLLCRR